MDLSYGEQYEDFRAQVQQFLKANWPPSGEEAERPQNEQYTRFRQRAIEAGYVARGIPKRYGGSEQQGDVFRATIIREEFARARAPADVGGIGPMMLIPTLLEVGAEWQKEPPRRKVPRKATTIATSFGRQAATRSPGESPRPASACAARLAARSSSSKDSRPERPTSASRDGASARGRSISSAAVGGASGSGGRRSGGRRPWAS